MLYFGMVGADTEGMASNGPGEPEVGLARLLETPEPLAPGTALTAAAARFTSERWTALPVVEDGRLVGLITARGVLAAMTSGSDGVCRDVVRPATALPVSTPLEEALWLLRRDDVEVLPVLGLDGRYRGLLAPHRVLQAVEDGLRPRVVGGMATPVGVHLTSVHHRGGVGDLPLVMTGFVMVAMMYAARFAVAAGMALASDDPVQIVLGQFGASSGLASPGAVPWLGEAMVLLLFLTFVRLSPLAGFHSGEHQTVHAVERGLPLALEPVAAMPRPHPRCGTNLALLAALVLGLAQMISNQASLLACLPLLVALVYWKRLGSWVQAVFTTRPARPQELQSGIDAARMLLNQHRRQPGYRAPLWLRIWNRGLLQVLAGAWLAYLMGGWASRLAGWAVARSTL